MNKNNTAETAKKGQAATKNNIPTGKVKTLKSAEERRKAREEQYKTFRVNALRRRCKRMKISEEDTEKYVTKLIEQMGEPAQYSILVMFDVKHKKMIMQAINNKKIKVNVQADTYLMISGDQKILGLLREINAPSMKIYPRRKKAESVIPEEVKKDAKKPSNNTAEKKAAAKAANKGHMPKSARYFHRMQKGRYKELRKISLAYKRSKKHKATTVQLNSKTSSTGSKKASTNLKKAA